MATMEIRIAAQEHDLPSRRPLERVIARSASMLAIKLVPPNRKVNFKNRWTGIRRGKSNDSVVGNPGAIITATGTSTLNIAQARDKMARSDILRFCPCESSNVRAIIRPSRNNVCLLKRASNSASHGFWTQTFGQRVPAAGYIKLSNQCLGQSRIF